MNLKDFTNIDFHFHEGDIVFVIEVLVPSTGHFPWVKKLIGEDTNIGPVDKDNLDEAKKFASRSDAEYYLDSLNID